MDLYALLQSIEVSESNYSDIMDVEIEGIHFHSKKIKSNYLFVAITGYETDGHEYIDDAIKAGASIIIGEKEISRLAVPYIKVKNSRNALAKLASRFYRKATDEQIMIGVTGTNGKTTTTRLLRYILEQAGIHCSLIGTVSHMINGVEMKSDNTTPDALTIQELIYKSDDSVIILEVSSHGLEQDRVEGIQFDYAIFTNLSHDHLNYHHSTFNYFKAKTKLFKQLKSDGEAIVCSSSEWGKHLIHLLTTYRRTVYSIGCEESDDIQIQNTMINKITSFELKEGTKVYSLNIPLQGLHNIWNASLAFMVARRLKIKAEHIIESLDSFPGVPGRFETYDHPCGAKLIIDYAHTPDAFVHCLQTVKEMGAKRIIHVFGFRGNGDPSKRKKMIAASSEWSHQFILTLDDLNGIASEKMVEQLRILNSSYGNGKGKIIADRTEAIQYGWEQAEKDDVVLITGKGAEEYKQAFMWPAVSDADTIELFLSGN